MLALSTAGAVESGWSPTSGAGLLAVALVVSMAFGGKNYHVAKSWRHLLGIRNH
jgi:hypothetical protein